VKYTLPEVHKIFRQYFNCKPPLDGLLMMVFKRPIINLSKFDEIFHEKHGNYEERNMSMGDVLKKEYPADIAEFIEWLIGANNEEE